MIYSIRLSPEALDDLEGARDYFDGAKPGLGDEFLDEFETLIESLRMYPQLYPSVRDDIRRGVFNRFSYIFTYTIDDDDLITILRVIHTAGNTEYY